MDTLFLAYLKRIKAFLNEYKKYSEGGSIVTFDALANTYIKNLIVGIDAVQSGSGDPSPENVRPISGWDEVSVTRTGKNILPNGSDDYTTVGITFERRADGGVRAYGTATGHAFFILCNKYELPSGSYKLTGGKSADMQVSVREGSTTGTSIATSGTTLAPTFTISEPQKVGAVIRIAQGTTLDEVFYPMICFDSLDDTFEPYQGNTITTDLTQTVYGGTLDVVSGELTVTDGYIASYNGETLPSTWISDRDVYVEGTTPTIGAEVCYKLTAPQTIQLAPKTIKALKGTNNIWCDTGNIISFNYYGV